MGQRQSLEPEEQKKTISRLRGGESPDLVFAKPKQVDDVWLTPEDIVEAVRAAFYGEIVCDPCSTMEGGGLHSRHARLHDRARWLKPRKPLVRPDIRQSALFESQPWIARAIRESAEGKRIYLLLPARTGSTHQAAILNEAIDVLFVDKRVAFPKPGQSAKRGRNAVMTAGLLCSTQPLVDMGISCTVILAQSSRVVSLGPDGDPVLTKRILDSQDERQVDEPSEVSEDERREAEALLISQVEEFERHIKAGRKAVSESRLHLENLAVLNKRRETKVDF